MDAQKSLKEPMGWEFTVSFFATLIRAGGRHSLFLEIHLEHLGLYPFHKYSPPTAAFCYTYVVTLFDRMDPAFKFHP